MNSANESKQKKTAQVVRTRPAGPDHQVVTIEGAEWVSSPALQRLPLAEGCRGRISTGSFRALGQHRIRHGAKHLCVPPVWCSKAGHLRRIFCCAARITTCPFAWDTLKASLIMTLKTEGLRSTTATVRWLSPTALTLIILP